MNIRETAIAAGLLRYNTGRPCKRGHISERYTSNGNCCMCLNGDVESRRVAVAVARGKKNLAKASGCVTFSVLCKPDNQVAIAELAEALQFSKPDEVLAIRKAVHDIYLAAPTQRSLSRDDLLPIIDYRDGKVHNASTLELSHPDEEYPDLCIIIRGLYYNADHCILVLMGQRANVKPTMRNTR